MRTTDNEIRIVPTVDHRELDALEKQLQRMDGLFRSMAGSAAKIHVGANATGGAGGTNRSQVVDQMVAQGMPGARARSAHAQARAGGGQAPGPNTNTVAGLIGWFANVWGPAAPDVQSYLGLHAQTRQRIQQQKTLARIIPSGSASLNAKALQSAGVNPVDPTQLQAALTLAQTFQTHQQQVLQRGFAPHGRYRVGSTGATGAGTGTPGGGRGSGAVQAIMDAAGFGELGHLIAGGAAAPLGAAALGVGWVASQARQGWSTYHTQGTAFSALSKSIGDLGESFNTLRNIVNNTGMNFAETLPQITQVIQTVAPYTGNLGTAGMRRYLTSAQGLAFAYGLNPGSTAQAYGQFSQIGVLGTNGNSGQLTPNQFAALIGNAVSAGNMQGRQGQVLSAMLSVSQQLAQQIGQAPNANLLASIMTSLNQSNNPVLQGALGAQVLNSINQGIVSPGMGPAGQLAEYHILNPNGKLGYFQVKALQNQGLNGINPTTGVSNFAANMQYYQNMLKGGKVTGTWSHGVFSPSEQTSAVMAEMAANLLHNPAATGTALNLLRAFQGKGLTQENATQALAAQLGPNALNTIISKGGIGVFAGIANATGVGGKNGLNALAHQITGTLHGHVSSRFYALEKQYAHAHTAHQRALDLGQMKTVLGQSLAGGPTLGTSMDQLNRTMAQATKEWAKIGRDLQPLVKAFAHLNLGVASTLSGQTAQSQLHSLVSHAAHPIQSANPLRAIPWLLQQIFTPGNNLLPTTSAYTIPGLSGGSSQAQYGATLASFVQGNQQSTFVSALQRLMGGTNSSATSSPYQNTSYSPTTSGGLPIPGMNANIARYNPTVRKILGQVAHRNPLLSTSLVDAVMLQQDASGNPNATYHDSNGTQDAGLMQINSSNWARLGIAGNPYSVTGNLHAGITMLNQLLNQYGSIGAAAYHYAGSGPQAAQDSAQLLAILQKIEKNTRPLKQGGLPAPRSAAGL